MRIRAHATATATEMVTAKVTPRARDGVRARVRVRARKVKNLLVMACTCTRETAQEAVRVWEGESEGSGGERAKVGEREEQRSGCGERDGARDHEAGEGEGARERRHEG